MLPRTVQRPRFGFRVLIIVTILAGATLGV